jgi:hypothetical protein
MALLLLDTDALRQALTETLPSLSEYQVDQLVARLSSLAEEWDEVDPLSGEMGLAFSVQCQSLCPVAQDALNGTGHYRVLRRRTAGVLATAA